MSLKPGGAGRGAHTGGPGARRAFRAASARGFTILESLIAIGLLVTGLVAISNLLIVAGASNSVANQHTAAATVAAERMEMLKARPFADVVQGGSVDSDVSGFNRDDEVPGVGIIHSRWEVVPVAGDPATLFIRVRAQGTGALSGARSRAEFTTFRTCPVRAAPYNCP